jgi:hypothetical protein
VEDYYVQGTEAARYWLGAGADRLQAFGVVDRAAVRLVNPRRVVSRPSDSRYTRRQRVPSLVV